MHAVRVLYSSLPESAGSAEDGGPRSPLLSRLWPKDATTRKFHGTPIGPAALAAAGHDDDDDDDDVLRGTSDQEGTSPAVGRKGKGGRKSAGGRGAKKGKGKKRARDDDDEDEEDELDEDGALLPRLPSRMLPNRF